MRTRIRETRLTHNLAECGAFVATTCAPFSAQSIRTTLYNPLAFFFISVLGMLLLIGCPKCCATLEAVLSHRYVAAAVHCSS
eukprot:scaffold109987_cov36-Prasinocladus_malaysianus.AAC.1